MWKVRCTKIKKCEKLGFEVKGKKSKKIKKCESLNMKIQFESQTEDIEKKNVEIQMEHIQVEVIKFKN